MSRWKNLQAGSCPGVKLNEWVNVRPGVNLNHRANIVWAACNCPGYENQRAGKFLGGRENQQVVR